MTGSNRTRLPSRIRSFSDALQVLGLAGESKGIPSHDLRAQVVSDPDQPETLADFAVSIMLVRRNGRLQERGPSDRVRRAGAVNLWFVGWGSIGRARDGGLILTSLALAPRLDDSTNGSDVALGITAEVLRVVSPTRLLSQAVSYLRHTERWLEAIERAGGPPAPPAQKRTLRRVRKTHTRRTRTSDDEIATLAARYVTLYRRGIRRPLPQLAEEFGITTTQVRDRIHRARHELGYLTPGKQGRAGAEPTERLLKRKNLEDSGTARTGQRRSRARPHKRRGRDAEGDEDA
jgi:hypothetical protein